MAAPSRQCFRKANCQESIPIRAASLRGNCAFNHGKLIKERINFLSFGEYLWSRESCFILEEILCNIVLGKGELARKFI